MNSYLYEEDDIYINSDDEEVKFEYEYKKMSKPSYNIIIAFFDIFANMFSHINTKRTGKKDLEKFYDSTNWMIKDEDKEFFSLFLKEIEENEDIKKCEEFLIDNNLDRRFFTFPRRYFFANEKTPTIQVKEYIDELLTLHPKLKGKLSQNLYNQILSFSVLRFKQLFVAD